MKSFIKLFSSVKLTVFLLIVIILATVVGTLIPQGRSPEAYSEKYGNWAPVLMNLGITHVYRSSWYLSLLVLFSINIITCSLARIKNKFLKAFKPRFSTQEKKFTHLSLKKTFESPLSVPQAKESLKTILNSKGYKVREKSEQGNVYILSRKRSLGIFGSDMVHLGILVVVIGGFLSGAAGYRENLALRVKETKPVPKADFSLKLNRFETLYHTDGSVKDWKSTLAIVKNDQRLLTKTIEVNHPLSYQGYVFYQSGYGWDWRNPGVEILIERKSEDPFSESIRMKVGETTSIKHKNIEINALYFVPDFVLTEENKVTSRSLEPNNPAVYVKVLEKEKVIFSGWLFLKYPEFNTRDHQANSDLSLKFRDFKAEPYSVIQIAKDPGVPFIWTGCAFVMLGLFLAFYFIPRELKFMIKKEPQHTKIYAGGIVKKAKDSFKREFDLIIQLFKESK